MTGHSRLLGIILTSAAVLWMAAIFFVPLGASRVPGLSALIHAAGDLVCHQQPERSFSVAGHRFPVCGRCTGLYVSGALAALAAWLGCPRVPRRTRALVILAAMPTALSVGGEWAGLGDPGNAARALAAIPLGGAAGWLFVRMLRAEGAPSTCVIIS